MKAMVVRAAGKGFTPEERPAPVPRRGEVRIRVHACGVCFSDHLVADGVWPGLQLPRVPGHEIAGEIDAIGEGVSRFSPGDRVGLGWHGGHDGSCDSCLRGQFVQCDSRKVTGITMDGGYAEQVVAPAVAVARIPAGMSFEHAAPLMCAGVTTFNSLRNAGARPGDLVAVHGVGGLGHLGVMYARAMGFHVAALSRGTGKKVFAERLGAHQYIDTEGGDVAAALQAQGGARVILATAPHAKSMSSLVAGLGVGGCLLVVGAPSQPMSIGAGALIAGNRRVQGWASGSAADSTDAMAFAALQGIQPIIQTYPLRDAQKAYDAVMDGSVRFRSVIVMSEASASR
jgi:D-arabinose 1-dehydrogenase-like Zn-dependent alcohol dehydrogenase